MARINFADITDQQYADLIAYFVRRKNVDEIVIHDKETDVVITRKVRHKDDDIIDGSAAACCGLIATLL